MAHDLTPKERTALDELLPTTQRTGNLTDDLATAARIADQRRRDDATRCGLLADALYRELRSWRQVTERTGIPWTTARRWAKAGDSTD